MQHTESMIKTTSLEFSYKQSEHYTQLTLNDVNLEIPKGQFLAILGHNGSGKSTLAKHFNGILLPTGGKVLIAGMSTLEEDLLFDIRRRCGMVFQNPDNQIVATITEEDVAFGPENLGVAQSAIRDRVDNALKAVGMYEFRDRAPHMLSGGQKQRVAIAGIIAMQPECIVLDEPTAMLDPAGRRDVLDTIHKLNKTMGITVILITHHMEEAVNADRVIVMNKGTVTMDGSPKEIFVRVGELRELGLTVPQTVELLYALSRKGITLKLDALSVEECAEEILKAINK